MWNVGIAKARNERYDETIDQRKNIKLRSPLQVGEKVFVLSSRLKKKDPAGQFYKSTTENRPFFDRNRISTIKNCTNINGINYYWITENDRTIKERFLREELFALKNQFLWKMEPASIYISETNIDKENKFTLNFCEETDVKTFCFPLINNII